LNEGVMISPRSFKPADPELDPRYLENLRTYERLKTHIEESYPKGHFIGINDGRIVADAGSIDDLIVAIEALGHDPKESLAFRAGERYPDYAAIF